jgi:hypothetical protein
MLTWSVAWGAVGGVLGAALALVNPGPGGMGPDVLSLARACAMAGALAGATSALAYSLALIAAARRRRFDELRVRDLAVLGGGTAFVAGFLISRDPVFATSCGSLGLAASAGSLVVARRAAVSSGSRPLELRAGLD